MADKYHISPSTGNPNKCYASVKPCPLGGAEDHYPSKEAARAGYEKKQASNLGGLKKTKKQTSPASVTKKVSTPAVKTTSSKKVTAEDDDAFYDFKEVELEDLDFDPSAVDEWEDDLFKEEKDEWGDDDDVWDSSRMNPDDYEEKTGSYTYSWER